MLCMNNLCRGCKDSRNLVQDFADMLFCMKYKYIYIKRKKILSVLLKNALNVYKLIEKLDKLETKMRIELILQYELCKRNILMEN